MDTPDPKIDVDRLLEKLDTGVACDSITAGDVTMADAAHRIRSLLAEHEALRADFEKHALHNSWCYDHMDTSDGNPCICGLAAARVRWARTERKA